MFQNCKKIKSLDLSKLVVREVTDMSYMFYGCSS
jgi:surface protein